MAGQGKQEGAKHTALVGCLFFFVFFLMCKVFLFLKYWYKSDFENVVGYGHEIDSFQINYMM